MLKKDKLVGAIVYYDGESAFPASLHDMTCALVSANVNEAAECVCCSRSFPLTFTDIPTKGPPVDQPETRTGWFCVSRPF